MLRARTRGRRPFATESWCDAHGGWGPWDETRAFDFTQCFEDTAVIGIPLLFLVALAMVRLHKLLQRSAASLNGWGPHYWLKMVLAAALTHYEHTRSRHDSNTLLIFWLLYICAYAVKLRTLILLHEHHTNLPHFVAFVSTLGLAGLSFALECRHKRRADQYANLEEEPDLNRSPEETANIFSIITFWWLNPLMRLGRQKPLSMEDLWALARNDQADAISHRFQVFWEQELKKTRPSLLRACVRGFGGPFIAAAIFKFAQDVCAFIQPQLLRKLLAFIKAYGSSDVEGGDEAMTGYLISAAMLLTAIAQSLCLHRYFQMCVVTGMRLRTAMVTAIYRKSLRLSSSSRQNYSTGEIVNHMSVDAQRFNDLCSYLHILWSGPFQIALALYFLYQSLGPSIFAGVGIMLLMVPINGAFARRQQALQKRQMRNKDSRLKLMDEVLNGIKVIKLYAWEKFFMKRIFDVREQELATLKSYGYLTATQGFFWNCTPFLVSFATFGVYTWSGTDPLTSEKAFVALSLFNLLQFPLSVFPNVISSTIEASVALNRIFKFLTAEEVDPKAVTREPAPVYSSSLQKQVVVTIKNGTFRWERNGRVILNHINLDAWSGELVGVVGKVGSAKSSILSAILGDMYCDHASDVRIKGSVAFVSEDSWILNDTIRENIIFGHKFDAEFYEATIKACCLEADFAVLPGGDLCEVGERGVNLSGGQKKRINLARAVYARADIYLLDDPLSAVDAHVGKHIFEQVFGRRGILKDRCRILVTHGVYHLPKVDKIVYMKDGIVAEYGTYAQLMSNGRDLHTLVSEYGLQDTASSPADDTAGSSAAPVPLTPRLRAASMAEIGVKNAAAHGLTSPQTEQQGLDVRRNIVSKEEVAVGSVSRQVYLLYARACSLSGFSLYFVFLVFSHGASVGSSVWLKHWAKQNDDAHANDKPGMYLAVYGAFGLIYAILIIAQILVLWIVCAIRSARQLHASMLDKVIRSPMSFFDTQPIGRTLNRFSKARVLAMITLLLETYSPFLQDQFTVDEVLPRSFYSYFRTLMNVVSIVIVVSVSTPGVMAIIVPIGILYYWTQLYYLATSRELKRLDSVSRSPVFSHFSETLGGVSIIRAFQQQKRFIAESNYRVDENQKAYFPSVSANRWLAIRLEFLGAFVVFGAALSCVLEVVYNGAIDASTVGLSVTYALSVTSSMNWMVRQYCEIETNIVSVERIKQYLDLETEAPSLTPVRPSPAWPDKGTIEFDDYSTRYREGLDLVLRNLNISIRAREKVGIVGRTGSGKSSILLSLFRMIEPVHGRIVLDNMDITRIGLYDLRSRLTIIPQDPTIFAGTLRENLDPYEQHDDMAIWDVLASVRMKEHVSSLEGKLNARMQQGGTSFSLGQRQLICLARALLRRTKIIVLDEATAQIDVETDRIIQHTIREQFDSCTILTIAHRINTVIDNDRILVLSNGEVSEFDAPSTLLKDPNSLFYQLVEESGLRATVTEVEDAEEEGEITNDSPAAPGSGSSDGASSSR
ncbi:hypothetical protein RI367_005960 [Sorochytrium milnesiophthora]